MIPPVQVRLSIRFVMPRQAEHLAGLDVFRHHDKTAPPPILEHGVSNSEDQPTIWGFYTQRAEHYDRDLVKDANNTVEVLLIFVSIGSLFIDRLTQLLGWSLLCGSHGVYLPDVPDASTKPQRYFNGDISRTA
jgi:hypothetical protein